MTKGAYKKIWITSLISLVFLIAGVSLFAWKTIVNPPEDKSKETSLVFGEGGTVTTVLNINDVSNGENKALVPANKVFHPDRQTASLKFTLKLLWNEHENSPGTAGEDDEFLGDLKFSYQVDGLDSSVAALINVNTPDNDVITFNLEKEIEITITLTIPENIEQYQLIKGKEISITLKIEIENPREK